MSEAIVEEGLKWLNSGGSSGLYSFPVSIFKTLKSIFVPRMFRLMQHALA